MSIFSDPTLISALSSLFSAIFLGAVTAISRFIVKKLKDDRYKAVKLSLGNMVNSYKAAHDENLQEMFHQFSKWYVESKNKKKE